MAAGAEAKDISFNRDIRPILSDRCFACHGPDVHDRKAKLRLDKADGPDGAYRTHEGSTAIKPGSIKDSQLWYRITTDDPDDVMPPPKAHKKLISRGEQQLFKQWIEAGAVYEGFWAFQAPARPKAPAVENRNWSRQPIDLHVLRKLEAVGLTPSAEADRRTLIRRVSLDLTGLPPTREEVRAFLEDRRPDAYARVVERLIGRKQYGEHMARYWLDLVRFADTNGMHKDFYRNFVAYRDWVIRAFNDNLGYDDFVRYQLAGDLFPEPNSDQLVASGFNRLHLIIDRGTALPEESHAKNVFDRVTAVGTAFLGMTVHCAMCHDHKYDPLTQKDFYSLFAFFNNIDAQPETQGGPRNGLQPPTVSLATPQQQARLEEFSRELTRLEQALGLAKKTEASEKDPARKKSLASDRKKIETKRNALKKQRDQF
ncbi:MAG: DUF1549 domain-containing protein, partial [Phycisphaerae bacterium]|nr:DUF1549 domain-containing protein [Phycisphaerae bacterium]